MPHSGNRLFRQYCFEYLACHREKAGGNQAARLKTLYYQTEWPKKKTLPPDIRPVASKLSVEDGLLIRATGRTVIPATLRADVLEQIHAGHQGIQNCRERGLVWWPGLSKELEVLVQHFKSVSEHRARCHNFPELPWQKQDLFEWRKPNYLLIVYYYSRYIEIANQTTATEVISHAKSVFTRHGIPETDNGPQQQR